MNKLIEIFFFRYPRKSIRLLEIALPVFSLSLITLPVWGALFFPLQFAYFIIFFDVFWFYKSITFAFYAFLAEKKIREEEVKNWGYESSCLQNFSKVNHVLIIPNYKESVEKLKDTIDSIKAQSFPLDRLFVVLAMEKREKEARSKARQIRSYYKGIFGGMIATFHPHGKNEVIGKSSNQAYAAKMAYKAIIKKNNLDINFVTVTSVDADAIFDRQYFSYLAYKFLNSKAPFLSFWQGANVDYNNFWKIPSVTRAPSFFGSLWRTAILVQGSRLIPTSTYSLSFRLLKEIGYWDTDVVPEDYRIFFKAFFRTRGKIEVEPIFLKTSMDCALSKGYFKTLLNKYHQVKRWAWGISDDPLYLKWYFTVKNINFFKKTYLVGTVLIDHVFWPVYWFIITVSVNLIILLNPVFTRTSLGYNLPRLSGFILTFCLVALLVLMFVDYKLRKNTQSETVSFWRQLLFPVEFIFMPVSGFFFSSFPALVSHLHLLFGKRLEYKVTEKV